jgi:hypothetical protein
MIMVRLIMQEKIPNEIMISAELKKLPEALKNNTKRRVRLLVNVTFNYAYDENYPTDESKIREGLQWMPT